MGIVLALVSSLLWGIADFAGGSASRRLPALVVVLVSQVAGLVFALVVATSAGAWSDSVAYLGWAVLAGLVGAVGLLAFYRALAVGTMGVVSPIAALGVIVPVVVGLATGHLPSAIAGAGIVLAIIGVVAASGPERSAGRSLKPIYLASAAAVGFGVVLLLIARGAETSPIMTMVAMRVTSVTVLGLVWAITWRRARAASLRSQRVSRRVWGVVLIAGLFDVGANLAFAIASTAGAITIIAILGSLYPAVTVLLARVIHGERMTRLQQGGVVAALIGVALIAGWS